MPEKGIVSLKDDKNRPSIIDELFHLPAGAHENMSAIPDNGRLCRDFRGIFL